MYMGHPGVQWRAQLAIAMLCFPFAPQGPAPEIRLDPAPRVVIVSPSHPKDSRGEVVYETQGVDQKNQPVVSGTYIDPSPIRLPEPKYPKSMKKAKSTADVTVLCVVTPVGDTIDAKVTGSSNDEASASALEAVSKYRFKPGTLDGKPVASLMQVIVHFRLR